MKRKEAFLRNNFYLCGMNAKPVMDDSMNAAECSATYSATNARATSPYRPHNPGHNYYEAGAYLITLVIAGRERRLSTLNDDAEAAGVELTAVGRIVEEEWAKTAAIQGQKGRAIETRSQVCMPDHWHGVIVVKERMDKSLGYIIQCFKSACTARWRREVTGFVAEPSLARQLAHMSKEKRRAFYATRPLIERPLFDDDYDDTICMDEEHLKRMVAYVDDNPRRAILRRLFPQYMQRCLHVVIAGRSYAAFGNLFLLDWVKKEQVFCHRKARLSQLTNDERRQYGYAHYAHLTDAERRQNGYAHYARLSVDAAFQGATGTELRQQGYAQIAPLSPAEEERIVTRVPYETTAAFRAQGNAHYLSVMAGATVLITPGISEGEKRVKNMALERGLPLIHLQKEPIGPYWKPEKLRFDACTNGRLLILAPWNPAALGNVGDVPQETDYSQFHNMNDLAKEICEAEGYEVKW